MSTRTPLIAGNWKMFKTCTEARDTAADLAGRVPSPGDREIMIAPQFTALVPVSEALAGSPIALGAQNVFWENEGAYTGEVSPAMLTAAGCRFVIIGHSERRFYFRETDESVNKKIGACLAAGLVPVMCIGETEAQRDAGETFSVLDKQVQNGVKGFDSNRLEKLVIAYEPVWAIGTGKTATADQAQQAHAHIRQQVAEIFGTALADGLRLLYGGSVKPANIKELMEMPDIDGALIGGASLDAETFSQIINY